jgi:hypothetical protein
MEVIYIFGFSLWIIEIFFRRCKVIIHVTNLISRDEFFCPVCMIIYNHQIRCWFQRKYLFPWLFWYWECRMVKYENFFHNFRKYSGIISHQILIIVNSEKRLDDEIRSKKYDKTKNKNAWILHILCIFVSW